MPNLPISGLPASSTLQGDELFADVQGGVTKYTTLDDITNYLTVQDGVDLYLTGSAYANTAMIHIDWTGANRTMDLFLPDATAAVNVNRSIRFISDSTFETNTRAELTPLLGQTLDGSASSYTINKAYEGIMVWSDGVEWYRIQTKAG